MKVTELSKLCNVTRQTIYNNFKDGLSELEILEKYNVAPPKPINKEVLLLKDLKEIKKIIKMMILGYQNSLSREIKFNDVDTIYEIVKKY